MALAGAWTLLWGGVGVTQLWKERGDEAHLGDEAPSAALDSAAVRQ